MTSNYVYSQTDKVNVDTETKSDVFKFDKNMDFPNSQLNGLRWTSPQNSPFCVSGFAWYQKDNIYRRMPLNPNYPLPVAVSSLANHTAGGQIRFQSNTKQLAIRVKLTGSVYMSHMAGTGQCGFDCYIGTTGCQYYVGTAKFSQSKSMYEYQFFNMEKSEMRNITINMPLYQGVKDVQIGLDTDAEILPPVPYANNKRIIVYGTSITQGGCASRPGMAYTNILSRRLNYEFINLGFSGSGRGEADVAKTVAEIESPACYILDYEPNCISTALLKKTLPEFVKILREQHKNVPIIVVSTILSSGDNYSSKIIQSRLEKYEVQSKLVDELQKTGDANIYFIDGSKLLGTDFDECTVDGLHPTDLGFYRIANNLEPILRKVLNP